MTRLAAVPALALDTHEVVPPETSVPRFWRPALLAPQFGVSRMTIYNLLKRGDLEAIRIAGMIRIPESSILAYLARCRGAK